MRQFCDKDFPVYMYGADGSCVLKTMGEVCALSSSWCIIREGEKGLMLTVYLQLLPDSFSPADLEAGQAANPEK